MPNVGIQYPNPGPFDGYLQFEACAPGVSGVWYTGYVRADEGLACYMAVFEAGAEITADAKQAIYTQRFHPREAPITDRIALPRPGTYIIAYRGQKLTGSLLNLFRKSAAVRGQLFLDITDWDFGPGKTRPINPESITLVDLGSPTPKIDQQDSDC